MLACAACAAGISQALRAVLNGWPRPTLWGWALRAQARAVVARPPPAGAPSTRRVAVPLCAAVSACRRIKPRYVASRGLVLLRTGQRALGRAASRVRCAALTRALDPFTTEVREAKASG